MTNYFERKYLNDTMIWCWVVDTAMCLPDLPSELTDLLPQNLGVLAVVSLQM